MKTTAVACTVITIMSAGTVEGMPMENSNEIVLMELQPQTEKGQDFEFNFSDVMPSDGTGGMFSIHASGDYGHSSGPIPGESLTWSIEGILSGGPVGSFLNGGGGTGGPFDFVIAHSTNTMEFQRTYVISPSALDSIISDGMVNVFVDLGTNVDNGQFVEVRLAYHPVPEVGSAAIAASGVLCLLGLRRRRRHRGS